MAADLAVVLNLDVPPDARSFFIKSFFIFCTDSSSNLLLMNDNSLLSLTRVWLGLEVGCLSGIFVSYLVGYLEMYESRLRGYTG